MGCLVVLLAFLSPRLALFAIFLFSDLLSRAFDSWFVPFLGFFLLPWTTLAYAVMWASSNRVSGFEWFIVVLAFAIDLGSYARGSRERRGGGACRGACGPLRRPYSRGEMRAFTSRRRGITIAPSVFVAMLLPRPAAAASCGKSAPPV